MNLRTYLLIKQAAGGAAAPADAAADPKLVNAGGKEVEGSGANVPALVEGQFAHGPEDKMPSTLGRFYRNTLQGAKDHAILTALGAGGGATLGGLGGLGVANLAGLSGDNLSTAGRIGRYALIGGGALTGGLAGGAGTAYLLNRRDRSGVNLSPEDKSGVNTPAAVKKSGYYPYYRY